MSALLNVVIALLIFGVIHSLTAALPIKALFVDLMGARGYLGLYRLFYNFVSVITFLPVLVVILLDSGGLVWDFRGGVGAIFSIMQLLGILGLGVSLLQIDLWRFLGISQAWAWWDGRKLPLPDEGLVTGGVYAITRHPLYLFSMMFLWFNPSMSWGMLGLTIGSSLYFMVGSFFEESRLLRDFGADYIAYRKQVAWLIPFLKLPQGQSDV